MLLSMPIKRSLLLLLPTALSYTLLAQQKITVAPERAVAYREGVLAPSANVKADGPTAVEAVTRLFILNKSAKVGDTGKPLPSTGHFSALVLKPESCHQDACFGVLYRVPEVDIVCTWLVGFSMTMVAQPDGPPVEQLQPHVLDEDQDAQRYTIKIASMPWERLTLPIRERNAPMLYPSAARAANIGGVVFIVAVVDEHGNVIETSAQSGPTVLSASTMSTVRQWHFQPAMVGNKPVVSRVPLHFTFGLYGNAATAQIGSDGDVYSQGGFNVHGGTLTGNPDQRQTVINPADVLRQQTPR